MRLSPDIRGAFNKLVKKGLAVTASQNFSTLPGKQSIGGSTEPDMWAENTSKTSPESQNKPSNSRG